MKSFLLKFIAFALVLVLLVVIPLVMLSKYDNIDKYTSRNHNIISLQTKSKFSNLDYLFIGNSFCYSAIDTRYIDSLGLKTFNLGIATAGVEFYDLVINDYLNNVEHPPKNIMILVSPMTFSNESDNYSLYPIHRYLEIPLSHFQIAIKFNRYSDVMDMYKKSIEKTHKHLFSKSYSNSIEPRLNNFGFFSSTKIVDENIIKKQEHLYTPLKANTFNPSKVEQLLSIAKNLENKGINVTFFEVPTHLLNNYFSKDYLEGYLLGVKLIRTQFDFISIKPELFEPSNFRNIDHMNDSGALIATKEFLRILNQKNSVKQLNN